MDTIGFLGSGNMAEALIKAILTANLYKPQSIFISDIKTQRTELLAQKYDVIPAANNAQLAGKVNILVLSIKPQDMTAALESIKDTIKQDCLIISIAAGIEISAITQILGDRPIVRVMPNTPALIGEAASALFANPKAKPMLKKAQAIFQAAGKTVILDREDLLHAVTAISGSGPAYYFLLMEEMINKATHLGLSAELAQTLVLQTAKGAALLAQQATQTGQTITQLRQKVTSPGGTTEAALKVLTKNKFSTLIADAINAAHHRSLQLSTGGK